jgi:hypothetical protein
MTMKMFEFSIIASGLDPTAPDFEKHFHDAGCDDALVSFQKGHIIVDFAREAATLAQALASAIDAVRQAGATVDRVEPDPLVSLSEIAGRTGLTRAAMTQYSKGQRGTGFPPPVARITSDSPLWDWASVARWLCDRGTIGADEVIEAELVKEANEAIALGDTDLANRLARRLQEVGQAA